MKQRVAYQVGLLTHDLGESKNYPKGSDSFPLDLHLKKIAATAPRWPNPYSPKKLTWNPKMELWKMIFLFKQVIFRFHVSFRGCSLYIWVFQSSNNKKKVTSLQAFPIHFPFSTPGSFWKLGLSYVLVFVGEFLKNCPGISHHTTGHPLTAIKLKDPPSRFTFFLGSNFPLYTTPKTNNIAPENRPFESPKRRNFIMNRIPAIHFQGLLLLVFGRVHATIMV